MKYFILIIIILIWLQSCSWEKKEQVTFESDTLFVYTSEVFLNEDFYDDILPIFEQIFKCKIKYTVFSNAAEMLAAVVANKDSLDVDVVLGVDNTIFYNVLRDSVFLVYEPQNLKYVEKNLIFDNTYHVIPIYFGQLAFIYNSYAIEKAPATFGEMQDGKFKKKIILMHPESSALGRGMLLWSVAAFGENGYSHFWRSVKENIYSIADNYDEAYNMFLAGQAPLVIGYSTSPVYHIQKENSEKYKSTIPSEGSFNLITGAGIIKNTDKQKLAKHFIDFLLSDDFQGFISDNMWMYPVNNKVNTGSEYKLLPFSKKDYSTVLTQRVIRKNLPQWIAKWESIMLK
ncbi:MAG: thiamine ABC transporter substrate-binding protein [Candidatus Cloacimonadales bacterium]|nr:thiamine ABC transporter substrate-binding protein [Candidatus Cloacimonadales bacterium]